MRCPWGSQADKNMSTIHVIFFFSLSNVYFSPRRVCPRVLHFAHSPIQKKEKVEMLKNCGILSSAPPCYICWTPAQIWSLFCFICNLSNTVLRFSSRNSFDQCSLVCGGERETDYSSVKLNRNIRNNTNKSPVSNNDNILGMLKSFQ